MEGDSYPGRGARNIPVSQVIINKIQTSPKLVLTEALDVHSWLVFVFMFVTVKLHTVCKIAKGFLFCFHYGKIPLAWKLWGVLRAVSVKIIIPWPFCFSTNVDNHLNDDIYCYVNQTFMYVGLPTTSLLWTCPSILYLPPLSRISDIAEAVGRIKRCQKHNIPGHWVLLWCKGARVMDSIYNI